MTQQSVTFVSEKCLKNGQKRTFPRRQSAPKNTFWLVSSYIFEKNYATICNHVSDKCVENGQKRTFPRGHSAPTNTFWLVLIYISEKNFPTICNQCLKEMFENRSNADFFPTVKRTQKHVFASSNL